MPADQPDLTAADRELLAQLAELVTDMAQTPDAVLDGAKALHDWANVDARLGELVADPVLTRGDGTAFTFAAGQLHVRAEVEPAGYRRRRLAILAQDETGGLGPDRVSLQFSDGSTRPVLPDRFGDFVTDVPAGTLRAVAAFGAALITTPWFVV